MFTLYKAQTPNSREDKGLTPDFEQIREEIGESYSWALVPQVSVQDAVQGDYRGSLQWAWLGSEV